MDALQAAHEALHTMLGHLGFAATIEEETTDQGPSLQISTDDSKLLIGRNGERLDDLQFLVNKVIQRDHPDAPRIRVDCDHFRVRQEESLQDDARRLAEKVKESGKPMRMRPLNAYHRRLVHNALVDDPEIETFSPRRDDRMKRIEIRLKR